MSQKLKPHYFYLPGRVADWHVDDVLARNDLVFASDKLMYMLSNIGIRSAIEAYEKYSTVVYATRQYRILRDGKD